MGMKGIKEVFCNMNPIDRLGIAISDFVGQHGLMWSEELRAEFEAMEDKYYDDLTEAWKHGIEGARIALGLKNE
jgi:hypothetical protein